MNEVEMEHRLTETEALTRDNTRRINDLEADYKVLQELTSSVKVMAEQFKTMNEKINKIDKTVQRLTGNRDKARVDTDGCGVTHRRFRLMAQGDDFFIGVVIVQGGQVHQFQRAQAACS